MFVQECELVAERRRLRRAGQQPATNNKTRRQAKLLPVSAAAGAGADKKCQSAGSVRGMGGTPVNNNIGKEITTARDRVVIHPAFLPFRRTLPALWHFLSAPAPAAALTGKSLACLRVLLFRCWLLACSAEVAGALLLIRTPARTFGLVLPWLLLLATLLFAFGRYFARFISARISHEAGPGAIASATTFEMFVATYGGYFGGGKGIMNLAMFAALAMTDIHAMNKLKVVLGSTVNGVATITFIIARAIFWPQALVMTVGAALGGYASAHYAQKLPHSWIRALIIVVRRSHDHLLLL